MNSGDQQQAMEKVRFFLQPIAPLWPLGLYAYAAARAMVGAYMAGWCRSATTAYCLAPFVAVFGGIVQFIAGLWRYRARDGLATGFFRLWGSFWTSYGLLYLLFAGGVLPPPSGSFPEFAFWHVVLAWITLACTAAAAAVSWPLTATLATGTLGAAVAAAGEWAGSGGVTAASGWILVISALLAWYTASSVLLAWYTASSVLLESTFGRAILPAFRAAHARRAPAVPLGEGEPGVRRG